MDTIDNLTPLTTGASRYFKRLNWSIKKRLTPNRERKIHFDRDLVIYARPVDRLARRVLLDGYSDRELAIFLDRYLRPGMVFFDIGAHFGQFTLMGAKRVSKGEVHAFEPATEAFGQLCRNAELNGFHNIHAVRAAVYEEDTMVNLHVCISGMGEFNSLGRPMVEAEDIAGSEAVRAVRLDTYCRESGVERIDLMKIDVEGAELSVLHGGSATLSSPDAPVLFIEFNERTLNSMGTDTKALKLQLESLGYQLYRFDGSSGRLTPYEEKMTKRSFNLIALKNYGRVQGILAGPE